MGLVHRKILLRTLSEMEVIKSTPTQPVPLRRPCPGGDARPRCRPRLIGRRMFYFRIETMLSIRNSFLCYFKHNIMELASDDTIFQSL